MSAVDVVTEALNSMPADARPSELVNRDRARIALEALKAAGYVVVELPRQCIVPTGWGDDCLGAWPASGWDDPVSAWPRRQVATPDDKWIDPDDARSLAAALLAAANAAEAQS